MANKMLIDASHPEETRVVTVKGSKVEEFDFEAANRRQLRGNIYLAKVTRVEPSLQAAFVEYGGNRHGFLAFSEIHPDYYQIPVADRLALLEEDARAEREQEERPERNERASDDRRRRRRRGRRAEAASAKADPVVSAPAEGLEVEGLEVEGGEDPAAETASAPAGEARGEPVAEAAPGDAAPGSEGAAAAPEAPEPAPAEPAAVTADAPAAADQAAAPTATSAADQAAAPTATSAADQAAAPTATSAADQAAAPAAEVAPEPDAAPAAEAAPPAETLAAIDTAPTDQAAEAAPETAAETAPGSDDATDAEADEDEDEDDADEHDEEADEAHAEAAHADEHDSEDEDEDDEGDDEDGEDEGEGDEEEPVVEQVGGRGDALAEIPDRPRAPRRHYKIQEVIKRRQVILVQVVKEERGNKGAALTTYLSLAGRYSVLMPNTGRGGGISRKITSAADRKRLKEIAADLEVPDGMGVILRTAGASRTKPEIKRDFEYLMRLWESVRELTLSSSAPALVYEEGSLIKRAIRDLYNKDIDEVLVAGDDAYREAKDFMRMLMPSQSKVVKPYRDPTPLFARYGVEQQLDAMFSNHVALRSGGYLVINPTEALVSIDVNSGRATREHDIEDTALKTNLEAAEEVARQLRLRDLAGLIVIDFIDMEEKRNNRAVERKLNECLKDDRARIQVGRISPFGLLEMSRQRIRTGVLESSSVPCPHCGGSGFVRATSSVALQILRAIEEALIKSSSHNLILRTRTDVALYILNQKRGHLRELETRFGVSITVSADERLPPTSAFHLDRGEPAQPPEPRLPVTSIRAEAVQPPPLEEEDEEEDETLEQAEGAAEEAGEAGGAGTEDEGGGRRRRRRRRRRGRGEGRPGEIEGETEIAGQEAVGDEAAGEEAAGEETGLPAAGPEGDEEPGEGPVTIPITEGGEAVIAREGDEGGGRRRRRGRRGGRSRDRHEEAEVGHIGDEVVVGASETAEADPAGTLAQDALAEEIVAVGEISGPSPEAVAPASPAEMPDLTATEREAVRADAIQAPEPEQAPAAPEPEPVAVVLTPPDPDRPKRAGWWSRTKAAIGGE
ncbi:Rne/Rng family ribonuclease [Methylobacterium sp. WSM2598]|uniref:Rne/Rng family ribonuclease n=1 Tax=Methylobacterium sp. WSM2598 TaxID=398261 RepID=UPI0003628617|nr:ribonuclease E/G [Methylobacterium sp. WSM2598]